MSEPSCATSILCPCYDLTRQRTDNRTISFIVLLIFTHSAKRHASGAPLSCLAIRRLRRQVPTVDSRLVRLKIQKSPKPQNYFRKSEFPYTSSYSQASCTFTACNRDYPVIPMRYTPVRCTPMRCTPVIC